MMGKRISRRRGRSANIEIFFQHPFDLHEPDQKGPLKKIAARMVHMMRTGAGFESPNLFASASGISQPAISGIEKARLPVGLYLLAKIANACHCDLVLSFRPRYVAERTIKTFAEQIDEQK